MKVSQRKQSNRFVRILKRLAPFLVIIAFWECASRLGWVPKFILPSPSTIIATLFYEIFAGTLFSNIMRSLLILVLSLIVDLIVSLVIILACIKFQSFKQFYKTIATMMNSIPSMALLPLIIMWFGIGDSAIVALVTHSVVWTFTIYILDGINSLPKIYQEFADNINLDLKSRIKDIYIPALLPNITTGLKVVWGRAWRSLIGAEVAFGAIGAAGGLGYYININRYNGDMPKVFAGIIIIATIGLLVDLAIFSNIEKKMRKWGTLHE